jgi:hypothetical protein
MSRPLLPAPPSPSTPFLSLSHMRYPRLPLSPSHVLPSSHFPVAVRPIPHSKPSTGQTRPRYAPSPVQAASAASHRPQSHSPFAPSLRALSSQPSPTLLPSPPTARPRGCVIFFWELFFLGITNQDSQQKTMLPLRTSISCCPPTSGQPIPHSKLWYRLSKPHLTLHSLTLARVLSFPPSPMLPPYPPAVRLIGRLIFLWESGKGTRSRKSRFLCAYVYSRLRTTI